jgi:hypothetical protein
MTIRRIIETSIEEKRNRMTIKFKEWNRYAIFLAE